MHCRFVDAKTQPHHGKLWRKVDISPAQGLALSCACDFAKNRVESTIHAKWLIAALRQCGIGADGRKVFFDQIQKIADYPALRTGHEFAFHQSGKQPQKFLPLNFHHFWRETDGRSMQVQFVRLFSDVASRNFVLDDNHQISAVGDDAIKHLLTIRRFNRRRDGCRIRRKPNTDAGYRLAIRNARIGWENVWALRCKFRNRQFLKSVFRGYQSQPGLMRHRTVAQHDQECPCELILVRSRTTLKRNKEVKMADAHCCAAARSRFNFNNRRRISSSGMSGV